MKLGRSKRSGRQRLRSESLSEKPQAYAYYGKREEGSRQQRQVNTGKINSGRFWLQRIGAVILVITIIVSTISVLSLTTKAKIMPVDERGFYLHDIGEYQMQAEKILAKSIWNHNKITINTDHVAKQLESQYPELASANVTLPLLGHRPIVYLEAAKPGLLLATSSGTYMIDTSGRALVSGERLAAYSHLNLPKVTDQSGLSIKLNQQAMSSQQVAFIKTIKSQLAAKKLKAATMTLPSGASQLEVRVVGQAYYVKFNLQENNARQQVGTYLATKTQLQKQNIVPKKYIDVRVPGRAYYQ